MLTPDMAPSSSPISSAFVVPTAWLHVPMATPFAMRLFTRKIFDISGAKMAPRMPVIITAATVMDVMPPSSCDTAMAMGVVTDFGMNDTAISSPRPSSSHSVYALIIETHEPTRQPQKMGMKCCLRIWRWRYTEYASATVAGPSRKEINWALDS